MNVEEGLRGVAGLARLADDAKVRLAAYRTILEAHGALNSSKAPVDRSKIAAEMEKLIGELRRSQRGSRRGGGPRVRARLQVDVDTHPEETGNHGAITHTPDSGNVIETAITPITHKTSSRAQD